MYIHSQTDRQTVKQAHGFLSHNSSYLYSRVAAGAYGLVAASSLLAQLLYGEVLDLNYKRSRYTYKYLS